MQQRSNAKKSSTTTEVSDLEKYGAKILSNTMQDAELEEFFLKYNGAGSTEINDIVRAFVKYLDIAQQYQLCHRLIPLEAKHCGLDRFLRNKSLASLCLTALMNNLGYTDAIFQKFVACAAPHDFLLEVLEVPPALNSLFHFAYAQFPKISESDKAKLDANVVFFLVTTPIINGALQIADDAQVMNLTKAIRDLTANPKSTLYCQFFGNLYRRILSCPADLIMATTKTQRQVENDCITLRNEARQLSSRDKDVLVSWPTVFTHIRKTPETEDKIQETRCHNMIKWYLSSLNSKNLSNLDRIVGDTDSMMEAISRNHPNWINVALIKLVREVYEKAEKILENTPDKDHRMKLLLVEISTYLKQLPTPIENKEERKHANLHKKK